MIDSVLIVKRDTEQNSEEEVNVFRVAIYMRVTWHSGAVMKLSLAINQNTYKEKLQLYVICGFIIHALHDDKEVRHDAKVSSEIPDC